MIKKFLLSVLSFTLHVGSISLLIYILWPIAKWYINSRPILGVDFYLTVNLASVLKDNFALPWAFWNYGWFGGWPQFTYPFLTIYLASFLSGFWDMVKSVQMMAIGFTLVFVIGSYFLFFRISKNHILSFILAVFTGLSGGVYQTLTWAGSVPSYSAQAALPWALGFLIWHQNTNKTRYLLASSLIAGISIYIHPLVFMTYIFPAVVILIFTRLNKGFAVFTKIKQFVIFFTIALLIGLPQFSSSLDFAIKSIIKPNATESALSTTKAPSQLDKDIAKFNQQQVGRILSDNNVTIFLLAGVLMVLFLATLIFSRRIFSAIEIIPYLLLCGYFWFYIWLFGQGISIYHGGWYRVFWSVPIWIGAIASAAWFYGEKNVHKLVGSISLRMVYIVVADIFLLILSFIYFRSLPVGATLYATGYRSEVSSAHPDILNIRPSDIEKEKYVLSLTPSWFNANETNWRMYDPDQTVNLWWNSLFKMPLARGYLDPPIDDSQRGYIFLLDAALSETDGQPQLVSVFKYPIETATSNALFLIDWSAIKYYEGLHVGGTSSPNVPAHLKDLLVEREEEVNLNHLKYIPRTRTLRYFEFKDSVTSAVLSATNASTMGVFASEGGFETVVRSIAERDNINSQRLIPINLGQFVDKYDLATLKNFDSLYLYDYDYKKQEKTFKILTEYVRSGKKVFADTGVEVKQSEGDLPEFFPVKKVRRKGQGMEWNFEPANHPWNQGIDFASFSPAVFDDDEWKTSSAPDDGLRNGAVAILKNHNRIVLASQKLGSGEVIWSGLNFAYHLSRNHNQEEAKFHIKLLGALVDLNKRQTPPYEVNFLNANNRVIKTQGARGILFKEQAYDGWSAKSASKNLSIFKAGPAYPGYIYIPLPDTGNHQAKLSFGGSFSHKFLIIVSFLAVLFIFEEVALSGAILGRLRKIIYRRLSFRVGKWWEKEDEE